MRYNILGFDQLKASKLGLSLDELMILRHFHDFASSGKMEYTVVEGEIFYWVKYDKFVEDLPILGMKKTRLMEVFNNNLCVKPLDWEDRYNKMSESSKKKVKSYKFAGVLKNFTKKDSTGTYSYFAFTKVFFDLIPNITGNDDEMKKAPVPAQTEATEKTKDLISNRNNSTDNISQSKKKDNSKKCNLNKSSNSSGKSSNKSSTSNKKDNSSYNENKTKFHNISHTFSNYSEDELERLLFESQKGKFSC